ncbi:ADP-ribosylation factor-like protein 2 [Lathyrus oleraceus]|uniref:ADP-ribosylation factor-like protein 2 n=1 Tax=Pisum sativum TaxID=3888 RepID=UPI0021CE750A|nr:ADP-ribosylation factor-like protein 2 [Pisum sativum]
MTLRFICSGLDNSGKTTIVLKINGEDTSVISPTLGFNIKTIAYQKYTLNIWDVGGQKTIRSYWRNYFEQTDGLVWVVDSSDLRRLDDCKMELDNLLKEERLSGASLLILANKQDIKGALAPDEIDKGVPGAYSEDAALKAYPNCETVHPYSLKIINLNIKVGIFGIEIEFLENTSGCDLFVS